MFFYNLFGYPLFRHDFWRLSYFVRRSARNSGYIVLHFAVYRAVSMKKWLTTRDRKVSSKSPAIHRLWDHFVDIEVLGEGGACTKYNIYFLISRGGTGSTGGGDEGCKLLTAVYCICQGGNGWVLARRRQLRRRRRRLLVATPPSAQNATQRPRFQSSSPNGYRSPPPRSGWDIFITIS